VEPMTFESDDLDRTEEFLSQVYAPLRIRGPGVHPRSRIVRIGQDVAGVDDLDFGFEMAYDVEPLGRVCIGTMHHGSIQDHAVEGWQPAGEFGPSDTFLLAPPDRGYSGRIVAAHYTVTVFDPALLDQVAQGQPGQRERPVRITGHRPVSEAAGRQLRQAVHHLGTDVLVDPVVGSNPLVLSNAARYLAACALAAFPNTALFEPTAQDRADAGSPTLRRAIAFMEANPRQDMSITDIARAAYVTPRALQLAFRRQLDTTPMAYLRQVRLDAARWDLQRGNPYRDSVASIAASWGFGDASRFTRLYRSTYGELPSHTLRS
jgi:AraC-like DNA-binding protein